MSRQPVAGRSDVLCRGEKSVVVPDANGRRRSQVVGDESTIMERVVLEIDAGEAISGKIVTSTGSPQWFSGWVELTSILERIRLADHPELNAPDDQAQK